jgi:hypothetical protein
MARTKAGYLKWKAARSTLLVSIQAEYSYFRALDLSYFYDIKEKR